MQKIALTPSDFAEVENYVEINLRAQAITLHLELLQEHSDPLVRQAAAYVKQDIQDLVRAHVTTAKLKVNKKERYEIDIPPEGAQLDVHGFYLRTTDGVTYVIIPRTPGLSVNGRTLTWTHMTPELKVCAGDVLSRDFTEVKLLAPNSESSL